MSGQPHAVLVNGRPVDTISALDRGLHYGDGLFETIAVHGGKPQHFDRHWQRLLDGCRRLAIQAPDEHDLIAESLALCEKYERAVLKIILTRGCGGRGYRALPAGPNHHRENGWATRILLLYDWPRYSPDYHDHGIRMRICQTRLSRNPVLAGIKHLNRLEQVLARSEWDDPAIGEGLMLDTDEYVIEGTMSNLFVVAGGTLVTPDLSNCGIRGVMRETILHYARREGIATRVATMSVSELDEADEIFICNSIIGIWPVRQLENRPFPVGPLTRMMQKSIASPGVPPISRMSGGDV